MSNKNIYVNSLEEQNRNKEQREMTFNGMNANEWAKNSKSVWEDLPFPRSESKVIDQDIIQEEVYSKIVCMYSKEDVSEYGVCAIFIDEPEVKRMMKLNVFQRSA